eukprot:10817925-Alexandrium_andersonii.AAC.1
MPCDLFAREVIECTVGVAVHIRPCTTDHTYPSVTCCSCHHVAGLLSELQLPLRTCAIITPCSCFARIVPRRSRVALASDCGEGTAMLGQHWWSRVGFRVWEIRVRGITVLRVGVGRGVAGELGFARAWG